MAFLDRFKDKITVLTKQGLDELIASRGIPIKNPLMLSFSRSAGQNSHSSSSNLKPVESSNRTGSITIYHTAKPEQLRVRPIIGVTRVRSNSGDNTLRPVMLSNREVSHSRDLDMSHYDYKSLCNTERKGLVSQSSDESNISSILHEKNERLLTETCLDETASHTNILAYNTNTRDFDSRRDDSASAMIKRVTFLNQNSDMEEMASQRSQSAVQRMYRSILKSQEGGLRKRSQTEMSCPRASDSEVIIKRQILEPAPVKIQLLKEAEKGGSGVLKVQRPTRRCASLVSGYKAGEHVKREQVEKWKLEAKRTAGFNSKIVMPKMKKTLGFPLMSNRERSVSVSSIAQAQEARKEQHEKIVSLLETKRAVISTKTMIIPKLKEKMLREKYGSMTQRTDVLKFCESWLNVLKLE